MSGVLDRHIAFVEALRAAGLPVSLAEDLDAVRAVSRLPLVDRETVRAGYAATLVKRETHRATFDIVFDLYLPALLGDGMVRSKRHGDTPELDADWTGPAELGDGPEELADFRERLAQALESGDQAALERLAREGIGRFGPMRGRAPGLSSWSAYTTLHRIDAASLAEQIVEGLVAGVPEEEPGVRRRVQRRVESFTRLAESDARRRIAEEKGAEHMARHAVRPSVENLDFVSARKADLEEMRHQINPLARRLASRLTREHAARRRGPLDFRRTVRASISTGGVPLETRHKPRRPGRTELVVLCDVSGSVASFAQFTLMLVFALREQFTRVRAFTFVDDVTEVTHHFKPGADPVDTMLELARSAHQASMFGRTSYGRAFRRFTEQYGDALTPRSSLLVLGDARSNYSDLSLPAVQQMVYDARHAWWLNPEHTRHWDTGDSAAGRFAELMPMVECRNLTQLGEFVRRIAG
ncbi:MAG: vWA domain-containing protein [Marmoricola sp.]